MAIVNVIAYIHWLTYIHERENRNSLSRPAAQCILIKQTIYQYLSTETFNKIDSYIMDLEKVCSIVCTVLFCVKPSTGKWSLTTDGCDIIFATGSELVIRIMNRFGHSMSYVEVKSLETVFVFTTALMINIIFLISSN